MKKKNLFVTFPVDFGSASVEKNYQKIFSETFNFASFSSGQREDGDLFDRKIAKKRYRFLASLKLRGKIKKHTKQNEIIIF